MIKKKNGNNTKVSPEANAVPANIIFPVNDFHEKNKDSELIPVTDERNAVKAKNFVDHNDK